VNAKVPLWFHFWAFRAFGNILTILPDAVGKYGKKPAECLHQGFARLGLKKAPAPDALDR
jgi:hypothetical protein